MLLRIMLHMELSSTRVIQQGICKKALTKILEYVKLKFYKSIMQPGEAIGVISAQSIGEPCTQLTLNSIDYKDKIIVNMENDNYVGPIGKFIEDEINIAKISNIQYLENDTTYVDIKEKNYKVVCVDEDGKTHWKLLEAVTKHLPGGKLLKVTTKSGRIVHATPAKSFLTRRNNKIIGTTGDELKVGDRLPITIKFPKIENTLKEIKLGKIIVELTKDLGIKLAKYLFCESYQNNDLLKQLCLDKDEKYILPDFVFISNKEFINGFISVIGIYDTIYIPKNSHNINFADQLIDLLSLDCICYSKKDCEDSIYLYKQYNIDRIIPGVNILGTPI